MITVIYNYGNGKLELYPEKFFPATKGQIRKLYKLFFRIGVRPSSEYVDECIQSIDERIPELEKLANEYVNLRTRQVEMKQQIKDKKKANGLPFRGEELKEFKKQLRDLNVKVTAAEADARIAAKTVPWLKENKKLLLELDGR